MFLQWVVPWADHKLCNSLHHLNRTKETRYFLIPVLLKPMFQNYFEVLVFIFSSVALLASVWQAFHWLPITFWLVRHPLPILWFWQSDKKAINQKYLTKWLSIEPAFSTRFTLQSLKYSPVTLATSSATAKWMVVWAPSLADWNGKV